MLIEKLVCFGYQLFVKTLPIDASLSIHTIYSLKTI